MTLLSVDGVPYIGHPNGPAEWTRNVAEAPTIDVADAVGRSQAFVAVPLADAAEREAVIRATWSLQPFPGNVIYAAARGHVRAVGVYFRLAPASGMDGGPSADVAVRSGE